MIHRSLLAAAVTVSASAAHAQSSALKPPVPGAPSGITAFVDVAVVPMDSERVLARHTVLVEGGRIAALGPGDQVQVPAGAARIDGRGKYLVPGLSECHAHLGMFVKQKNDTAAAEHALLLLLASGVTTVRNLDYRDDRSFRLDGPTLLRLRARAAAGELASPRIYTSAPWWGSDPLAHRSSPDSAAGYIAAYKAAGYDFVKIHDEDSVTFSAVMAAARRAGIPVVGHVPHAVPLEQALVEGYASFEHGIGYYQSLSRPDTALFRRRAEATQRAGVWNCITARNWRTKGVLAKALQDAGAGLLLGTDTPISRRMGFSVHRELATMVRAGLTPYQALLSGTRNMAEHLGISDESGTVAVGKRADLVLLAGNPLQDVRHTLHAAGVMVGGRWFTSEALAQRLGGVGESLRELIAEQKQRIYEDDAKTVIGALWWGQFDHDDFSSAQRASLDSIETSYKTRLAALADSVASSPNAPNESPQVLRLAARQLKEQREILTPEQQAVFDATARAWMKQYSD